MRMRQQTRALARSVWPRDGRGLPGVQRHARRLVSRAERARHGPPQFLHVHRSDLALAHLKPNVEAAHKSAIRGAPERDLGGSEHKVHTHPLNGVWFVHRRRRSGLALSQRLATITGHSDFHLERASDLTVELLREPVDHLTVQLHRGPADVAAEAHDALLGRRTRWTRLWPT